MSRAGTSPPRSWLRGLAAVEVALLALPLGAAVAHAAQRPRVAIIVLDTNISPPGARLAAERQEALAYVRALPPDVEAGLIVFSDGWRTVLRPTADRAALVTRIEAARPGGSSSRGLREALPGAVAQIDRLGASASGRLLLLSDGELLSKPLPAVAIPVDVVSSASDHSDDYLGNVRQVATASGGRYARPDQVAALATAFSAPSASAPGRSPSPPSAASSPAAAGWHPTGSLLVVLSLVFVALLFIAVLALRSLRRGSRHALIGQIDRYGPKGTSLAAPGPGREGEGEGGEGKVARKAVVLMAQVLSARNAEPRLAQRLERAGITRSPAEWALLGVSVCVTSAAALALLLGNVVPGVVIGVLAGWAGMRLGLSIKIARRRLAFDEQLPNVLQLLASSVQTGFSLAQALDAVVREDAQPASGEFARALAESRIGIDLADALDAVASRLQSTDLRWVVMAVRIQRETGGNLAEILRNTAATMRERAYLRRQVRALSAEGRMSAYILLALPVLVGAWLFYADPSYMRPLYLTFLGLAMLIGAAVLVAVGAFWMRNLIKVEM